MAPKVFLLLGAIFMVLILVPSKVWSDPASYNPFGFIQDFKGCRKGQNAIGLHNLKQYLAKYGYYGHHSCNDDEFDDLLESAIKKYQHNYGLKVTGCLDTESVTEMMTPRCGEADVVLMNGTRSIQNNHLTYQFRSSVRVPVTRNVIRSICTRSFQTWANVSHFTFQQVSDDSPADITIGFHRGAHGDGNNFDGPGGVFAHANGGNLHFDADEKWSADPRADEMDLESVTVHEIGHLLGLDHETINPDSIMFPLIRPGIVKRTLHEDDIRAIRVMYGLE